MRPFVNLAICLVTLWTQWQIGKRVFGLASSLPSAQRAALKAVAVAVATWCVGGVLINVWGPHRSSWFEGWARTWICGAAYAWAFSSAGGFLLFAGWEWVTRRIPFRPERRRALRTGGAALAGAPFALTGFGAFIERTNFGVREVDIPFAGLHPDLAGFRILQLSDIHLGPFLSRRELERVIDASNELNPHLAVNTGDLISSAGDPLEECLALLARVRATEGHFACMGNHEHYAGVEDLATARAAKFGISFLRRQAALLRRGQAQLNLAGVDYESVRLRPAYLEGAGRLIVPGALNVLLSHNPDTFPAAKAKGFDLTLSGHTHGGQVTVEVLHQTLNVARFVTPYVSGLYREGDKALYVTRGIGTIGLPARIGASPEITLIRLVRA